MCILIRGFKFLTSCLFFTSFPFAVTKKTRASFFAVIVSLFSILHLTPAQAQLQIEIDPGAYAGIWTLSGVIGGTTGPQTLTVDPGDYTLWIGAERFEINVAANGDVTSGNPDAATAVNNLLTFNTAPITIDPAAFGYNNVGLWILFGFDAFRTFGTSTPITLDLVRGHEWIIEVAGTRGLGWIRFEIDANGNIILVNPAAAATAAGNVLTFNTTPVTIDPAIYGHNGIGAWTLFGVDSFQTNGISTSQTLDLVTGLGYTIRIGTARWALFNFQLDDNGNVISLNTDAALGVGNTLTFNTTPITIDPTAYGNNDVAAWRIDGVDAFQSTGTSTSTILDVVPTLLYLVEIGSHRIVANRFEIEVGASGNITSLNPSAANAVGSVLTFNSTTISIDADAFSGSWSLRDVTTLLSGTQNLNIAPSLEYIFDANVSGVGFARTFAVAEPCAIDPTEFVLGGFTFNITCGAPDGDNDGVPDDTDNCPAIPNPDQIDQDLDGFGDVCDLDLDGDGFDNDIDNCLDLYNPEQFDLDGDGIGDACDTDTDGDTVPDDGDNCPFVPNTDQADSDADLIGDACDPDDDNDTVLDEFDNCRVIANPDQFDFDHDGEGDACDGDADGDGVANNVDICPDSPLGQPINIDGCTGAQLIAQQCQIVNFVQHGQYVSCVAHAANDAVDQGLINPKEKARFVKEAAKLK